MADWSKPVLSSPYVDFVDEVKNRDLDAARLFRDAATNTPDGAMKFARTALKFQEYSGGAFVDRLLSVAGGGTGSATASGARTNLGLGTMALQSASAVAITGGTIDNVTIGYGSGDNVKDIGSDGFRPRHVYIRSGLALPVGADKWIP